MKTSGNALFLILIAVALFAALSYAVTQSGRGGGSIDREQAELGAAQLLQYYSLLQTTVDRLLLTGCSKSDIAYEGASTSGWGGINYVNIAGTPADGSCQVFQAAGGGLTYSPPSDAILDSSQSGIGTYGHTFFVHDMLIAGAGINGGDDYNHYIVTAHVSDAVCLAINSRVHGTSEIPDDDGGGVVAGDLYKGTTAAGTTPGNCTSSSLGTACGEQTGCFSMDSYGPGGTAGNIAYHTIFRNAP